MKTTWISFSRLARVRCRREFVAESLSNCLAQTLVAQTALLTLAVLAVLSNPRNSVFRRKLLRIVASQASSDIMTSVADYIASAVTNGEPSSLLLLNLARKQTYAT